MESVNYLPSPEELARKAQEQTVPVSLRVKESTHAVLNDFAKQYNVTFGALVNELLNAYVKQFDKHFSNTIDLNDSIIDNYIKKKAIKFAKSTNVELIMNMVQNGFIDDYDEDTVGQLVHDLETLTDVNSDIPTAKLHDCFETKIIATTKRESKFVVLPNDKYGNTYLLYVPVEKWVLTASILCAYAQKFIRLYSLTDPKKTFFIDEKTLKDIEKILNKRSTSIEMAKKIANKIADFRSADD